MRWSNEIRVARRCLVALAAIPAAVAWLSARQPEAPVQGPTFRAGVDLVVVEATVVDRSGTVVKGLAASDFQVEIGGRRREVVSADLVEYSDEPAAPANPDVATNVGSEAGRTILIVVDRTSLRADNLGVLETAAEWVSTLGRRDRVGLAVIPGASGGVEFTEQHALIREGLGRIGPAPDQKSPLLSIRNVSLWEGLSIYHGDVFVRTEVVNRECRGDVRICPPDIEMAARDIFMDAQFRVRTVLPALKGLVRGLGALPGTKHVVLISSGWPIDARETATAVSPIAADAALSNAIVHTFTAEPPRMSAATSRPSNTPAQDYDVLMASVEMVSGLTGGEAARLIGDGSAAFEALARGLAGHYRLGVQPAPEDLDGTSKRISVKVTRPGLSLRSYRKLMAGASPRPVPATTDATTAIRTALESPNLSTALDLRATSYVLHDEANTRDSVRVVIVGDVARAAAGQATALSVLYDAEGRPVANVGQQLDVRPDEPMRFQSSLAVKPGRYRLRIAVRDAGGVVGTVDRGVDARWLRAGSAETTGLVLLRTGHLADGVAEPILDAVSPDDRVVAQLAVGGTGTPSEVTIEVAAAGTTAPLFTHKADIVRTSAGVVLARDVIPTPLLPVGRYTVSATVGTDGTRFSRSFVLDAALRARAPDSGAALLLAGPSGFSIDDVLARAFVGQSFARLAGRADTAAVRADIERVEGGTWPTDAASGPLAAAPVAASFVAGLGRLREGDLDAAAGSFKAALRAAPDFAPALVYLGVCYAAASKHREAAGAWQTALLREREWPELSRMAVEGWLRAGRPAAALPLTKQARARWPDDGQFVRLHAQAALGAGDAREGLDLVLGMTEPGERLLLLSLATLYEASRDGTPVWDTGKDRDVMRRFREAYAAAGGTALALVDAWLADVR